MVWRGEVRLLLCLMFPEDFLLYPSCHLCSGSKLAAYSLPMWQQGPVLQMGNAREESPSALSGWGPC